MSSIEFSADLDLQPATQRVVIFSGAALSFCGALMILLLPVGAAWQLAGCVVYSALSAVELIMLTRSCARFSQVRVSHDGTAALLDRQGNWRPAELLAGSWLLPRCGWLRFRDSQGIRVAGLFRGHCRHSLAWRRLQVIWRHVGAAS